MRNQWFLMWLLPAEVGGTRQPARAKRKGETIMAKRYASLTEKDREFAGRQKLFFLASASGGEVNLAPKGEDCFRFLDEKTLILLDYPGSSNRTGNDIAAGGAVTVLFCSFDDEPRVLRLFCTGEVVRSGDPAFEGLVGIFPDVAPASVRQIFRLQVQAVEGSCGLSVPIMRFDRLRESGVKHWAEKKAGIPGKD